MAINDITRQVDGFNGLPKGMDSSKEPNLIDPQSYAFGINIVARGGHVKTRPGFVQLDLESDPNDPDALVQFQNGDFQGAVLFTQPINRDQATDLSEGGKGKTYIIAVSGGWIFRIDPQTKKIIRINGSSGILLSPKTIVSLTASSTTVTTTTELPHNLFPGDKISISGCTPSAFNRSNATVLSVSSAKSFTYTASSTPSPTTATVVGSYSVDSNSIGYVKLPEFMDTTYYTLGITGAAKVSSGSGITNSSKVLLFDPHPYGITLGKTGFGFEGSATASGGDVSYITVTQPGDGFSKYTSCQVTGTTNATLLLRFARDASTGTSRPWPDQNHQTNRHYFSQAEKYLIIQDGVNPPFIFDGEFIRRSYTTQNPAISIGQGNGSLQSILVTHRGSGFISTPTVAISGGGGTGATAVANINASTLQVDSITITNAGSGYTSQPNITIGGGGGTGAKGYAILSRPSEVPIGTIMAYGQGRLFVANPNRFEILAMDLIGSHINKVAGTDGNNNTVYPLLDPRSSVLFNTEDTYLSEGGSFLMPGFMGKITGMEFVPVQDTATGQGQLYVFCEFGAASFNVGVPRINWNTTERFQSVLYQGIGAVGPDAFAQVNGDLLFRATDGLRSYRNATAQFGSWGNTAISAEMNRVLENDELYLLHNVSMAYTDRGRVLMTCLPEEKQPDTINDKARLSYKALVSLDFNTLSGSLGKSSAAYDGIWTGLDFVQLLSGEFGRRDKTYILAYSCGLLSCWLIDPTATEDKPIAGSNITIASATLAATRSSSTFQGSSTVFRQVNLTTLSPLKLDSYKIDLTAINESSLSGWVTTTTGTQGIIVSYATSPIDINDPTIFSQPAVSALLRSKTLLFSKNAGETASTSVDLGPILSKDFLYIKIDPIGTLPFNHETSCTAYLRGVTTGDVPIRSELETSSFMFKNMFELKRLLRGDFWFSNLLNQTDFEVYYRPDQYPAWIFWDSFYLLPQTTIAVRPLNKEQIIKTNVSTAIAEEKYVFNLNQYSSRLTRGMGMRLDFTTRLSAPGTGSAPFQITMSYTYSDLSPEQRDALVLGTTAYADFYSSFRNVNIPIPTDRTASRFINLKRGIGAYLYYNFTYPTVLAPYDVTITPYGIEQADTTPDEVLNYGFLTELSNLKPQFAPQIRLMNPQEQEDPNTNRLFVHGYEFQTKLIWTGNATIQKHYIHATTLVEAVGGNQ
jgi:hypothetical protein